MAAAKFIFSFALLFVVWSLSIESQELISTDKKIEELPRAEPNPEVETREAGDHPADSSLKQKRAFLAAARSRDVRGILRGLSQDLSPNLTDRAGDTILSLYLGDLPASWHSGYREYPPPAADEVVALLLEKGADPNRANRSGETPLYKSIRPRFLPIAGMLAKAGGDPERKTTRGTSALSRLLAPGAYYFPENIAAADPETGEAIIQLLQKPLANPDFRRRHIFRAVRIGDTSMVSHLLEQGVPARSMENGWSLLTLAVLKFSRTPPGPPSRLKLVRDLLARGARAKQAPPNAPTLLHTAVARPDILRLLIEKGADPRHRDGQKRTLLHHAASHAPDHGPAGACDFFIEQGLDVHSTDERNRTPLIEAARAGNVRCLRNLIKAGAKVDDREGSGATAFLHSRDQAIARMLLSAGAEPRARDSAGRNAIHYFVAAKKQDLQLLALLFEMGVPVDAVDRQGFSPFLLAARHRAPHDLMARLIAAGADVNRKSPKGDSALHFASRTDHVRAVRLLLAHAVWVNGGNSAGRTPLMEAAGAGRAEPVTTLAEGGKRASAARKCSELTARYESDRKKAFLKERAARVREIRALIGEWRASGGGELPGANQASAIEARRPPEPPGCNNGLIDVAESPSGDMLVKMLISQGADVNARDACGSTALVLAEHASRRRGEIIAALRAAGAKEIEKDCKNRSASPGKD